MLACWSIKGGVGTTVVAVGLAVALASRGSGRSVLVVDLGGDVPAMFGVPESTGPGLAEWLAAGRGVAADALERLEVELTSGLAVLPRGTGSLGQERAHALVDHLQADARPVVVDAGQISDSGLERDVVAASDASLLVVRACPLSLRALESLPRSPDGVVVVKDRRRKVSWQDVADRCDAPVVAELEIDPAVAAAVDAGVGHRSLPRGFLRVMDALA